MVADPTQPSGRGASRDSDPRAADPHRGPLARDRADPRVRPAVVADHPAVVALLHELDLDYPGRDLTKFAVLEADGGICGVAEVRDIPGGRILGCVGVREDAQGRGLGRVLVDGALGAGTGDVWLYTLIPGFFRKLGFEESDDRARGVPARWLYNCRNCEPESCRAMVRRSDDRDP